MNTGHTVAKCICVLKVLFETAHYHIAFMDAASTKVKGNNLQVE